MNKAFFLIVLSFGLVASSAASARLTMRTNEERLIKANVPVIESIEREGEEVYLSLSDGSLFKLRPVFYYITGWDEGDSNEFELFRKEYSSVAELLSRPGEKHELDFFEGKHCIALLPPTNYDIWKMSGKEYSRKYRRIHSKWENLVMWSWSGAYRTIPLNFHETSVNRGPLRANLYEHPENVVFFVDPLPNTMLMAHTIHAHLVEADLLEFNDSLATTGSDGYFQFKESQIHGRVISGDMQFWETQDLISAHYLSEGTYEIRNLSQHGDRIEAYLSDPGFSDLRKFSIPRE